MIALFILWPLYLVGIQYFRGGLWRVFAPITLFGGFIDIILNYTELALLTWDFPKKNEVTFSKRLKRLQYNTDWKGSLARFIAKWMLDWADPRGKHI